MRAGASPGDTGLKSMAIYQLNISSYSVIKRDDSSFQIDHTNRSIASSGPGAYSALEVGGTPLVRFLDHWRDGRKEGVEGRKRAPLC